MENINDQYPSTNFSNNHSKYPKKSDERISTILVFAFSSAGTFLFASNMRIRNRIFLSLGAGILVTLFYRMFKGEDEDGGSKSYIPRISSEGENNNNTIRNTKTFQKTSTNITIINVGESTNDSHSSNIPTNLNMNIPTNFFENQNQEQKKKVGGGNFPSTNVSSTIPANLNQNMFGESDLFFDASTQIPTNMSNRPPVNFNQTGFGSNIPTNLYGNQNEEKKKEIGGGNSSYTNVSNPPSVNFNQTGFGSSSTNIPTNMFGAQSQKQENKKPIGGNNNYPTNFSGSYIQINNSPPVLSFSSSSFEEKKPIGGNPPNTDGRKRIGQEEDE